ncbi:MAG: helix-turn-helix domain-containing protein [Nanoarchaeota archaeon]
MDNITDEFSLAKDQLAKNIIGEIVLSEKSENVIKKWRNIFKISQKDLAKNLGITSSVVSDYESGRRKSPGIRVIKKYVQSLINIDAESGGSTIKSFIKNTKSPMLSSAIIEIKELSDGITVSDFCNKINATSMVKSSNMNKIVYGYTIIDSLKAITELSFSELIKLYGLTTQRALIFTKVSTGRSPMVAIKLTSLQPTLVVLHGLSVVDDVAKRIAEAENIPLALSRLNTVDDIVNQLKTLD